MSVYRKIYLLNRNPIKNESAAALTLYLNDPQNQTELLLRAFDATSITTFDNTRHLDEFSVDDLKSTFIFFLDSKAKSIREVEPELPIQFQAIYDHAVNELHNRTKSIISLEMGRKLAMMDKKQYKNAMLTHDNTDFKNNEPLHGVIAKAFTDVTKHQTINFDQELKCIHQVDQTPSNIYKHALDLTDYSARADTIHNELLKNIKSEVHGRMAEYNERFASFATSHQPIPLEKVAEYYSGVVSDALSNSWSSYGSGFEWHKRGKCEVDKHPSEMFEAPRTSLITKKLPHSISGTLGFASRVETIDPWGSAKKMSPELEAHASKFNDDDGDRVLIALFPHKKKITESRKPKFTIIPSEQFDAKVPGFHMWGGDDGNERQDYSFKDGNFVLSVNGVEEIQDDHDWMHRQVGQNMHLFHHEY